MDYTQYQINASPEDAEALLAFFSEMDFESFEETPEGFNAYLKQRLDSEEIEQGVRSFQQQFNFHYSKHMIPHQNWNQLWESNFEPLRIGNYVNIRADFHPLAGGVRFDLLVNPKMAFGTGKHATTYMMILGMESVDFHHKKVFDYGCGTGVLAILASKLGAETADALDIDVLSVENTIENARANHVSNIKAYLGDLGVLAHTNYDVILANITRNIILHSLPTLYRQLTAGGYLLISGFLSADEAAMREALERNKFQIVQMQNKDGWICMTLCK